MNIAAIGEDGQDWALRRTWRNPVASRQKPHSL